MNKPTPEELRKADHPETRDELKQKLDLATSLIQRCLKEARTYHWGSRLQVDLESFTKL
jgi:hypothetical protein